MSTYNVQANSPIKKPEQKICVACGQPIATDVKPMNNHMNNYVAIIEGAVPSCINSNEDILNIQGVKLYKVGSKAHTDAVAASIKKPVANITPPAKPVTPIVNQVAIKPTSVATTAIPPVPTSITPPIETTTPTVS